MAVLIALSWEGPVSESGTRHFQKLADGEVDRIGLCGHGHGQYGEACREGGARQCLAYHLSSPLFAWFKL
jgi:hypothetical protein